MCVCHRETPLKQHMLMRRTHIYTSTDCPTRPLTLPPKCSCTQTESTPTAHYSFRTLPNRTRILFSHTGEHIIWHTHIHTIYTNRTLDTFPVNTIHPKSTHKPNYTSQAKTGSTCHSFIVDTTLPSPLTCTEKAKLQTPINKLSSICYPTNFFDNFLSQFVSLTATALRVPQKFSCDTVPHYKYTGTF